MVRLHVALALVCGLSPAAAHAQADLDFEAELQQVEDLIVTASPPVRQAVIHTIRTVTATEAGMVPRFQDPVCPLIAGASPRAAWAIRERLRQVASQVGAQNARPNCRVNLVILFVQDGPAALEAVQKTRPDVLSAVGPWRWRIIRDSPGPAWAWHATEMRDIRTGLSNQEVNFSAIPTRLASTTRWDTALGFLVIETGWANSLGIEQLSAYTAAAALAPVALDRVAQVQARSIYRLPTDTRVGNKGATTLTAFDLAYLTAIYRARPNARVSAIAASALTRMEQGQ
jgi:hypothetical protein